MVGMGERAEGFRVCVGVHGSCYHGRPSDCPGFGPWSEALMESGDQAAARPMLI